MPPETTTAPGAVTPPPRDIDTLVTQLSAILSDFLTASRATSDATSLMQIHSEYLAVQTVLNQAVNAQLAADDVIFAQATTVLKTQSKLLDGMEDQIKSVIKDVALAGKIVGYISQALVLIAKV